MAFPGELKGFDGTICLNCGAELDLGVYKSAAGYYLGYWCVCCGPYSRETGYYPDRASAEVELGKVGRGLLPDNARVTGRLTQRQAEPTRRGIWSYSITF